MTAFSGISLDYYFFLKFISFSIMAEMKIKKAAVAMEWTNGELFFLWFEDSDGDIMFFLSCRN